MFLCLPLWEQDQIGLLWRCPLDYLAHVYQMEGSAYLKFGSELFVFQFVLCSLELLALNGSIFMLV